MCIRDSQCVAGLGDNDRGYRLKSGCA